MQSLFTCCIGLSYLNSSQKENEKEQFSIDVILSTLVNTLQEIWSRHSEELLTKGQRNEFYSDFLSSEGHGHFCQ